MQSGIPSYLPQLLEINNSADNIPSYSSCYGGRHAAQALIPQYTGFVPNSIGIHRDIVNHFEHPFPCDVGCNVSNLSSIKLAPLNCGSLQAHINEDATKLNLRAEIPHLTRRTIDEYRLPFHQVISQDLLRNGYHYAFSELFNLYQSQDIERQNAGPDSPVWYIPPLSEQHDKLKYMSYRLSNSEEGSRRLDAHTVFNSYLLLGLYFRSSPDDLWLAERFFKYALDTAAYINEDGGLKLAIANQHYGMTLQEQGNLIPATNCLKQFYNLCKNKSWKDDHGNLLHLVALSKLVNNYLRRIDDVPESYHSDKINLCRKAQKVASESSDWSVEAPVRYRLGQLFEDANRLPEATEVYMDFFERAMARDDYINVGKACEALAKLLNKQQKVEESIRFLQKYANTCERHGQWIELGRACYMLGSAYDRVGNFTASLKWIKKAYTLPNIIQELKQGSGRKTTEEARIMIGISKAHLLNPNYVQNMLTEPSPCVMRTIGWKAYPDETMGIMSQDKLKIVLITNKNRSAKRDEVEYAKNSATGFMKPT